MLNLGRGIRALIALCCAIPQTFGRPFRVSNQHGRTLSDKAHRAGAALKRGLHRMGYSRKEWRAMRHKHGRSLRALMAF